MRELRDKLALVTGAASGIGRALALELAARGARLLLVDIDAAGLAETAAHARTHGAEVLEHVVDLADRQQVLELARLARDLPGGVDILINNAGIAYYGTTHEMTPEQLERVLAVNLHAPLILTHELLPALLSTTPLARRECEQRGRTDRRDAAVDLQRHEVRPAGLFRIDCARNTPRAGWA